MKRRVPRIWVWLAMIGSGATVFQTTYPFTGTGGGGNYGCQRFATNSMGTSIDFCYLLDCDNGFFGGMVDPCNDPSVGGAWLLDCGEADTGGDGTGEEDTGTGTGTGTDTGTSQGTSSGQTGFAGG